MVEIAAITSALSGIKEAYNYGKILLDARIDSQVKQEIHHLLEQLQTARQSILDVKDEMLALRERIHQLESEAAVTDDFTTRYALKDVFGGTMLYVLKDEYVSPDNPKHYLCTACFNEGKKAILNTTHAVSRCPVCKTAFRTRPDPNPTRVSRYP